ncbi:MAG: hypothetical protein IJD43_13300 [Thermoguttaceae bacterium]|nr:hypothetical protein [Thermoguttaceae bacterium]
MTIPSAETELVPKVFCDCSPDLKIYGVPGSSSERYAHAEGYKFCDIRTFDEPEIPTREPGQVCAGLSGLQPWLPPSFGQSSSGGIERSEVGVSSARARRSRPLSRRRTARSAPQPPFERGGPLQTVECFRAFFYGRYAE